MNGRNNNIQKFKSLNSGAECSKRQGPTRVKPVLIFYKLVIKIGKIHSYTVTSSSLRNAY